MVFRCLVEDSRKGSEKSGKRIGEVYFVLQEIIDRRRNFCEDLFSVDTVEAKRSIFDRICTFAHLQRMFVEYNVY